VKELLRKGAIVVMLGTGGVGKTTVAAALGLAAARKGLNTALITVDPARRLREALGLERLSSQPTRLDRHRLRAAGLDSSIRLSAMMLDVKRTWDTLVDEFIKSPEARCRILENQFYRSLTEQFAGAEAYAALGYIDFSRRQYRDMVEPAQRVAQRALAATRIMTAADHAAYRGRRPRCGRGRPGQLPRPWWYAGPMG